MSDIITVHFQHHTTDATLTLELPRNTVIDTLTPHLYEAGFIDPQKPGIDILFRIIFAVPNIFLETICRTAQMR